MAEPSSSFNRGIAPFVEPSAQRWPIEEEADDFTRRSSAAATPTTGRVRCDCIAHLFRRLKKLRRREMRTDTDGFAVLNAVDKHAWTRTFAEYFLVNAHCTSPACTAHSADDLLWYVRVNARFYVGANVSCAHC